jgi:HAD superfamily hydrolase (TIGR01450 family)
MQPHIGQFTTYLIDLDGVVYRGDNLLPGAKEFVNWLNHNHKKYLFLTNNSYASTSQVVTKLTRLGIATDTSHVLVAAQAAITYIARCFPNAHIYVVGEQPLIDLVRANGLHVANTGSGQAQDVNTRSNQAQDVNTRSNQAQDVNTHSNQAQTIHTRNDQDQVAYIRNSQAQDANTRCGHDQDTNTHSHKVDVVLVGLDRMFDYKKLTEAVRAVRAGATFIAINRDALLPIENGLIPGCGTMTAAIEAGSGITPQVIGKPQPTLLQEAMSLLDSRPEETIMIGDGLEIDILAGKAAGTHTLLVLSGKDSRESLKSIGIVPDYVHDNLAAVLQEISNSSQAC